MMKNIKERVKDMTNIIWNFIKQHVILVSSASTAVVGGIAIAILCFNLSNTEVVQVASPQTTTTATGYSTTTEWTAATETTDTTTTTDQAVTEPTEAIAATTAPIPTTTAETKPAPVVTATPTTVAAPKATVIVPTTPAPIPTPTTAPVVNDGWSYPYNLDVIYADCKAYATTIGLIYDDTMTVENGSWTTPLSTVPWTNGEMQSDYNITLKQKVFEGVKYYKNNGCRAIRIYFDSDSNMPGDYWVYMIRA